LQFCFYYDIIFFTVKFEIFEILFGGLNIFMTTLEIIFGAIILVFAVFLVIAVLLQHGKSHHLSGTIAGGAETFFGKEKGKTIDKMLSTVTSIVAVIFVIAVVILYILQT